MNPSSTNFFRGLTAHLLLLIILGFGLLLVVTTGIPYVLEASGLTADNSKFFYPILTAVKPIAEPFSYILMAIGAIVLSVKKISLIAWNASAAVALNNIHQTISENLSEVNAETTKLSEKVRGFVQDLERPITIGECNNREDYKAFAREASRGVYGPHVSNEESLYSFIESRILDPFCCLPHPSKAKKRIELSEDRDRPGYLIWTEKTSYNIHHVKYALTRSDEQYKFVYNATSYAPNLDVEQWSECLTLKINIDSVSALHPGTKPEFKENSKDDGFFCWKENEWINFRFQKKIVLNKEWTEVEMHEKSINSVDDKTYSLNATRPVYGYEIDLIAPEGFIIAKDPFVSPFMAYKGLPEFAKREVVRHFKEPEQDSENHMKIDMRGWVLPGIVATLNWSKK